MKAYTVGITLDYNIVRITYLICVRACLSPQPYVRSQVVGVGFNSNSKWFSNGQYSVCFRIEYLNRIEYFIRTVIVYVYVDSPSPVRRKVRDSTYALRTSKNIRFEFETIFECRKIRKTLKFSNFESNIFSNPTPIK
jgi:hypothetical protein